MTQLSRKKINFSSKTNDNRQWEGKRGNLHQQFFKRGFMHWRERNGKGKKLRQGSHLKENDFPICSQADVIIRLLPRWMTETPRRARTGVWDNIQREHNNSFLD